MPSFGEKARGEDADFVIVIDKEDGSRGYIRPYRLLGLRLRARARARGVGYIHGKRGAHPRRRSDADSAAQLPRYAVDCREAKTRSPVLGLGRKEGLENFI